MDSPAIKEKDTFDSRNYLEGMQPGSIILNNFQANGHVCMLHPGWWTPCGGITIPSLNISRPGIYQPLSSILIDQFPWYFKKTRDTTLSSMFNNSESQHFATRLDNFYASTYDSYS